MFSDYSRHREVHPSGRVLIWRFGLRHGYMGLCFHSRYKGLHPSGRGVDFLWWHGYYGGMVDALTGLMGLHFFRVIRTSVGGRTD